MELTIIAVVGVISIVTIAALSRQIGVAAPLVLVVVGVALSFLPGLPPLRIQPDWVLTGVLPPLLYASAVRMPAIDFRRDFRSIAGLAVLLVAVTTVCAGPFFTWLLPGLGLAAAFALGAVISPTDAVAATSVGRRLGLPTRLLTILEGEGLVNDASSLVLLGSAVMAFTHTVHVWRIGVNFLYAVVLAIVIGIVVGQVSVRVRGLLGDTVLNTAISFVVPFLAFLPAEEIGASGVLAVVVTGLVTGHQSPRYLRAIDRIAERVNWSTAAFLLESAIFLLMGFQLKHLLDEAGGGAGRAVWIGLAASGMVIVLRMLFVAPLVSSLRMDAKRAASIQPRIDDIRSTVTSRFDGRRLDRYMRRITQKEGDIAFALSESFGWRGGVVLAWSGMRGAVTVAAAQSLPVDTPLRSELMLIAFVVAVTTLLLQGLTLPGVIRVLKVPGDDEAADREEYRTLVTDLAAKARDLLDDPDLALPDGSRYLPVVVSRVTDDTRARRPQNQEPQEEQQPNQEPEPDQEPRTDPRDQYINLMLRVLRAEQSELLALRTQGTYNSRTLTKAQATLDTELARLQQQM
ncbi:MAG TPA: sodium:proton antiporter [Streptosporangiaceae bacterium]|jgi:CPA1 family monovalent cation:H+ antiporter